ncbi:hypothetical protein ElyMa_005534900 [Elysia marginata]|uniref:Uncharacterized protein n=1 Tax=Elysia marginata TaxID=1093978 RepID=A0AAV4EWY3_9GAST|nr:hypothetical protein ElyMa_005534900 [Elysia marginata]
MFFSICIFFTYDSAKWCRFLDIKTFGEINSCQVDRGWKGGGRRTKCEKWCERIEGREEAGGSGGGDDDDDDDETDGDDGDDDDDDDDDDDGGGDCYSEGGGSSGGAFGNGVRSTDWTCSVLSVVCGQSKDDHRRVDTKERDDHCRQNPTTLLGRTVDPGLRRQPRNTP